jgi:hypothetical protein
VRDLSPRINSPELTAAVQQVKANPAFLANFQQAVNFIALSVPTVKQSLRNIGAVEQQQGQGSRKPSTQSFREITLDTQSATSSLTNFTRSRAPTPYARGRGYRPPAYPPRTGIVFARGRGRSAHGPGYYSPQQWAALTSQQRDRILTQRGTKRNVSAISTDQSQDYGEMAGSIYAYQDPNYDDDYDYEPSWTEYDQASTVNGYQFYAAEDHTSQTLENDDPGGNPGNEFGQRSCAQPPVDDECYIGMFHTSNHHETNGDTTIIQSTHETNDDTTIIQSTLNIAQIITTEYEDGCLELDSHADTCTAGKNARVLSYSNKVCEVSPYHPQYKAMQNVPIAQMGVAYTHPDSGITYILVLNQALYVRELPHTLINPNQLRSNGIVVDDCPRHLSPNPERATHSIYIPELDLRLPLSMKGIISYLPT